METGYCRVNLDKETINRLDIEIIKNDFKNKSVLLRAFISDFINNPKFYKERLLKKDSKINGGQ